jgi:hypothetical protein
MYQKLKYFIDLKINSLNKIQEVEACISSIYFKQSLKNMRFIFNPNISNIIVLPSFTLSLFLFLNIIQLSKIKS